MTQRDPAWRRYLRFIRPDLAADLEDELAFHLESLVRDNIALGMDPDTARREAMQRFGDLQRVRERTRRIDSQIQIERRRTDMLETLVQDLRYAMRALRRAPGFTLVAVLTLALGIGANTAIFSVVNGVLLRPLPYDQPEQLVRLYTSFHGSGDLRYAMSEPEFMDYKGLTNVFVNAGAYMGASLTLTGSGEPQRVTGRQVTRDIFPVLGVAPWRGRNFERDEGRTGVEPVAIVSYEFWHNRLGADQNVVGSTLPLNGVARRVIGILPPGRALENADVFIPWFINADSMRNRGSNFLSGIARLKPGVTVQRAQQELDALTKRSNVEHANAYPTSMGYGASAISMRDVIVGDVQPALLMLLGAVGLVLLIACANVANLLLARGEARQREMAVRLAVGANRSRIMRQLFTESTVLALAGAAAGVFLAWWSMKWLLGINPTAIPRADLVRIDATVALVTLGIAVLTGIIFGLAPALQLSGADLQTGLKDATRGGSVGRKEQRLGRSLVTAEIALAVVVVIGAALLVRSFWTLRSQDPGFRSDNVLAVDLSIPAQRYKSEPAAAFYRELVARASALPGVRVAAIANEIPPVAQGNNWDIEIDGRARKKGEAAPSPQIRAISHAYFRALDIPIVRGRELGPTDGVGSLPVAIVNETAIRTIWRGKDPVGSRIRFDRTLPWVTIVGVSGDTRSTGLAERPTGELYLLSDQLPVVGGGSERTMYVLLKTSGDPALLATPMRKIVKEMDPQIAITGINSMDDVVARSISGQRFTMVLLGAFGIVALALASIGIYGIMSYAVRRRTREMGIRMALGAKPADVMRLVVTEGMRMALSGLVIGIVAAFAAARLISGLLYGISASDPVTYGAITVLLAGVALLACWMPARRAVLSDPTAALRAE